MNSEVRTLALIFFGADCAPKDTSRRAKITARDNFFVIFMLVLLIVELAKRRKSGIRSESAGIKISSNIHVGMGKKKAEGYLISSKAKLEDVLTIIQIMIVT